MEAINQPPSITKDFCETLIDHYAGLLKKPGIPLHMRWHYKLQIRYYTAEKTRLSNLSELSNLFFFII